MLRTVTGVGSEDEVLERMTEELEDLRGTRTKR